jgi:predicted regulator of Ras-like GTPase activity (Roadblock/LC7/MglB family)
MPSLEQALAVLRDVPGVDGAFVLDELGGLLARDAAFALPEAVLAGAAARISTLLEAAGEGVEAPKELTLSFASHRLVLRVSSPCVLAVLVRNGASLEAVRMASNIAVRHLVRLLGGSPDPSSERLRNAPMGALSSPSSGRLAVTPPPLRRPVPPSPRTSAPQPAPVPTKKKPKSDIWG